MKNGVPALPQGTNSRHAVLPAAETPRKRQYFQDARLAGMQESLPQQAEVTIGLLPACFPGKGTQWHRCRKNSSVQGPKPCQVSQSHFDIYYNPLD